MSWQIDAACRGMDTDLFFPDRNDHDAATQAKAVCAVCPVSDECLTEALQVPGYDMCGIFGGTTDRERRAIRLALGIRIDGVWQREKPCGTSAAYRRHLRNNESPCPACIEARRLEDELKRERAPRAS